MQENHNFHATHPVPKTPEQELQTLIEATNYVFKHQGHMKSNPLVAIWREGNLNLEWVMTEIELIRQKKSKLSAGKREAVCALVAAAISQFQQRTLTETKEKETETTEENV